MGLWDAVADEAQRDAICMAARDALRRVAR